MTITVIGHGYVGLVTASVFADFGNKVWVIGRTPEKIDRLKNADPIIFEPGLEELLQKNLEAGRMHFTLSYDQAIQESDIIFIAVGTPSGNSGEADLSQVFAVAETIGKHLKKGYTVVSCKSTVPVGTNLKVKQIVSDSKSDQASFDIVSCPEFLREGTGINDTLFPDRVIIGTQTQKAAEMMIELHKPINGERIITDLASAELIKYASNSMLATKISFANLISFYCQQAEADVEQVLAAVGLDKRIGTKFLNPGIGYGGACFPKDVKALIYTGKQLKVDTSLLDAVEAVNSTARDSFAKRIITHAPGKKIGIWGLSFKPNTDDIREAPSLFIINKLIEAGFDITAYDPEATAHVQKKLGDAIKYVDSPYDAIDAADAVCIFTEWNEFKQIDLNKVKRSMKTACIFDGRNIYAPQKMRQLGFDYYSVGRKPVTQ